MFEDIFNTLEKNKLTVSTAESCTGGMLASSIVDYSGASNFFIDGVVTYSNQSKVNRIGVKNQTLKEYGAVSKQTAKEMAVGVMKTSGSDIGLSTTGVAGPNGGTKEKPVGLVYIAVALKNQTYVKKLMLSGSRNQIRRQTVEEVFKLLESVLND